MASTSVPLHILAEIEAEVPELRSYAQSIARNATAAEDLLQEAVAKALAGYKRRPAGVRLGAWLMATLHNLHLEVSDGVGATPIERHAGPLEETIRDSGRDHRLVRRALMRARMMLPQGQQADGSRPAALPLEFAELDGLSYAEASAVTGLPLGTLRSRVARSRALLDAALADLPEPALQ